MNEHAEKVCRCIKKVFKREKEKDEDGGRAKQNPKRGSKRERERDLKIEI